LKFLVDAKLASEFKSACREAHVSMAGELTAYLNKFVQAGKNRTRQSKPIRIATRRDRRNAIKSIVSILDSVRDEEEAYLERMPDSLKGGLAFEAAESAVGMMDEAISLLEEVFG